MEFGQSSGEALKKRMSLGLSVADEKIKLIDVFCEDDYFLVPSLQSSISELERTERKEESMRVQQESRPSFLRRSLAWDSAFFDNSGVLDADELFYINNGANETSLLPANHEVRNRRSESEDYAGFSADWFEIQPSIIEPKPSKASNVAERSSKSGLKQNLQSSKKVDRSNISKATINCYQTSFGKSIDVHSQSKPKKESSTRRTPAGNKNFSGLSNLKMDNKSIITCIGQEKTTYKSSSNLQPSPSLSSAKFCQAFSRTAAAASSLSKRETESKKTPTSNISRLSSVRKKGVPNINTSTHSTNFFSTPANSSPSATLLSPVHKQRRSVDSKDVKEAANLQKSLQIVNQNGALSAKSIRPSGLRPPSPLHRFFDEVTPPHMERSRKVPQKKPKNPSAGAIDEEGGKKELDSLCRNFEAVALESEKFNGGLKACAVSKEENKYPNSKTASSRRTPLADKTSKCNFATATDPKREKFLRRASLVRYC